ncbi:MAG: baseplate J/gp47 family protein, partial [Candidatus Heimdallarchaeota archaeon]
MSNQVKITSLDFDAIKSDIKTFLGNQSEFSDFDFDGSGMSVILDILSYTTHIVSLQANMTFNEMFLDTATLRNTIVSRAKELNYIPTQKSAAIATITLSITDTLGAPTNITVPKGTQFTSLKDDVVYFFTTTQEEILPDTGGNVYSAQIDIAQGTYLQSNWVANNALARDQFIIQDPNVDVSYLEVFVKQLAGSYELWRYEPDITSILANDKVWFYQESFDELIEIYFGEGIIGVKPLTGEDIRADYLVTEGIMGNGISNFQLTDNVAGYPPSNFTVVVDQKSQQGQDEETIDRIKLMAPKTYEAQGRAVTTNDYRTLILNQFPSIQTMNVWGGEDNVPTQYGKVFLAIKPQYGTQMSPATKKSIEDYIQKFNVVGVLVELVDPEYIYVNVVSVIKYKGLNTSLDDGSMTNLIQTQLSSYISSQAANFGDVLYYSTLVNYIDSIETSIESNLTDFTLSARFTPTPLISQGYIFEYSNELETSSLYSTWTGQSGNIYTMTDDGQGQISVARDGITTVANQGSIDYITGIVTLA